MKRSPLRRKARFKNAEVDEVYRAWIREKPCLIGRIHTCFGAVQAAHVKSVGAGGGDRANLVPLCAGGHTGELHTMGSKTFEAKYSLDLAGYAARYWREYAGPFVRIAELDK